MTFEPNREELRRFNLFSEEMLKKFLKGRSKHGTKRIADPVSEAQQECLDLGCYALVIYFSLEELKSKVKDLPGVILDLGVVK